MGRVSKKLGILNCVWHNANVKGIGNTPPVNESSEVRTLSFYFQRVKKKGSESREGEALLYAPPAREEQRPRDTVIGAPPD